MKRSNQLVIESAVIASVLIMLTLGGSIATTTVPPSFVALQDPGLLKEQHDLTALAAYYNTTLTQIGSTNFANASFLIGTFRFVNIPPAVNATAQLANADLAAVNRSAANATVLFDQAQRAIIAKEYLNATVLTNEGCALTRLANSSLADFRGPQTARFKAEAVPTAQYSKGSAAASAEVNFLFGRCYSLLGANRGLVLLIGSPQSSIETGGTAQFVGNLTYLGKGVGGDEVFFYINGSYFGSLTTAADGTLSGTLRIPFVYSQTGLVNAFVPNSGTQLGIATSNSLIFIILFNQTSIVVADPPAYLPTSSFSVHGNLTTVQGAPMPGAPVTVTFLHSSVATTTNPKGAFGARFTVPANATDGTYYVYARFTPQGVFGPSVNFTSIQVYHLRLNLSLSVPSLSIAGLQTSVTGQATVNGSGVSGAAILVNTPWGSYPTKTDSTGAFSVGFAVSPLELALAKNISVTASPSQPYIASATVVARLGLFNAIGVIIFVAAVGIAAYEADRFGAFEGARKRFRKTPAASIAAVAGSVEVTAAMTVEGGPEVLQLLGRALILAAAKFSLQFKPNQTIREILSAVKEKEPGEAYPEFSAILLTAEDFLYSPTFAQSRLETARRELESLEKRWK